MRRLYSVFYHYFAIIAPAATPEQVAENSFLLFCFALYFPLSFGLHFCEDTFKRDMGVWGIIGVSVTMGVVLYWVLLSGDHWKRIVAQYPVRPVRKASVYLSMGLLLLVGLGLVFFPVV